jgi:hypothetical protein
MTEQLLNRGIALKKIIEKLESESKIIDTLDLKEELELNTEEIKSLISIARINTLYTKNRLKEEFKEL